MALSLVRRAEVGARLNPLPAPTLRVVEYVNPALLNYAPQRKASSLNSHRSRVFARREAFPKITENANDRLQSQYGRHSEPVGGGTNNNNFVQPVPCVPHSSDKKIPQLPRFTQSNHKNQAPPTARISRATNQSSNQLPPKLIGSNIAGVSTKKHDAAPSGNNKFAAGWAEARAGHLIPNLRESQVEKLTSRDANPDSQATARTPHKSLSTSPHRQPANVNSQKSLSTYPHTKPANINSHKSLVRKTSEASSSDVTTEKPAQKRQSVSTNPYRSKLSSGYGSMSSVVSNDPIKTVVMQKDSIFQTSDSGAPESLVTEKDKALATAYLSKVNVENTSDREKTASRSHREHEHILTEKEANMYQHVKSAYKNNVAVERERRKNKFFRKLQDVQIQSAFQHNIDLISRERKKEQTHQRQIQQLHRIRNKFEEERVLRYRSQYITKNFLNYERHDRKDYGLPETFNNRTEYQTKLKRSGGVKVTADGFVTREKKLRKNYVKMFDEPNSDSEGVKDPKMEGVDQITLDLKDFKGSTGAQKINVKDELKKAAELVKEVNDEADKDSLLDDEEELDHQPIVRHSAQQHIVTQSKPAADKIYEGGDDRKAPSGHKVKIVESEKRNSVSTSTTKSVQENTIEKSTKDAGKENDHRLKQKPKTDGSKATKQTSSKTLGKGAFKLTSRYAGKSLKQVQEDTQIITVTGPAKEVTKVVTKEIPAQAVTPKSNSKISSQSASVKSESSEKSGTHSNLTTYSIKSEPTSNVKQSPQLTSKSTSNEKSSKALTVPWMPTPESSRKPLDTLSLSSRISAITEESEADVDFYEKIMAKYGIELSDSEDDDE